MRQVHTTDKPFSWGVVSARYTACRLRGNPYQIEYPDRLGLGRGLKSWFLCILQQPHSHWDEHIPDFYRAVHEAL